MLTRAWRIQITNVNDWLEMLACRFVDVMSKMDPSRIDVTMSATLYQAHTTPPHESV